MGGQVRSSQGCCDVIKSTNHYENEMLYTFNGQMLNDRPVYVRVGDEYGYWFDYDRNTGEWLRGSMCRFDSQQYSMAYLQGNENSQCPTEQSYWNEFVYKKWRTNLDATVECSQGRDVYCCDILRVHNHREYYTIFKKTTTTVKGRPVYWKKHSDKVIWFNGHSWMYGNYADLAGGRLNI